MRNRALRGCLIAVFAFCFILLENIGSAKGRVKPQQNTQQTQQQPQADKRGTLDAPFVVKPLPADKNQQEADEDARDKSEKRWNDRITIFVAIATAVILILQLIVFGWQAHRLKQTIVTMKELGEKQSKDMQGWISIAAKSAEAAKIGADAAKLSAETTSYLERPYVDLEKMVFAPFTGENHAEPIVEYCFINAGRSYALVKAINISCLTIDNIPVNPPYDGTKTRSGHILFTPNALLGTETPQVMLEKCKISMPLSVSDWDDIRAGKKFLIVIGFVKYDSAFEVTYTHGFGYCFHTIAKRLAIIENDQYNYDRKRP